MTEVMDDAHEPVQFAAFLIALRAKGKLRRSSAGCSTRSWTALSRCPSIARWDNISTMAALLTAAGSGSSSTAARSVSSRSGSAGVLEALGIPLDLDPDQVARCVNEIGIGFTFTRSALARYAGQQQQPRWKMCACHAKHVVGSASVAFGLDWSRHLMSTMSSGAEPTGIKSVDVAGRSAPRAPEGRREPKLAVCLSGGGYRAMLYHVGALRRLNEFGLLSVVDRFSSVSGGSITAAVLARDWENLGFDQDGIAQRFESVERTLFDLAGKTIDWQSGILGAVPGTTGARQLARRYRQMLFDSATLQDLPAEPPRFVFNTTSMATGNLFRWSKPYAAEYSVGQIERPSLELAEVVAASSAFLPSSRPSGSPRRGRCSITAQGCPWTTRHPGCG